MLEAELKRPTGKKEEPAKNTFDWEQADLTGSTEMIQLCTG
jgi:hypothetical protein